MNPQIILALLQLVQEFKSSYDTAKEALAAQGADLDRLMQAARDQNHKTIWDMIGGKPGTDVTPPTPENDPTSVDYNTLDDAKANLGTYNGVSYQNVVQKTNGKFNIWPQVNPIGGAVRVWPPG